MKKMQRFIIRNWFWIALGCVLQKKAIELAYLERGFKAVGGEWFVLPIVLLTVAITRGMVQSIIELMKAEEVERDKEVMGNRERVPKQRNFYHGRRSGRSV